MNQPGKSTIIRLTRHVRERILCRESGTCTLHVTSGRGCEYWGFPVFCNVMKVVWLGVATGVAQTKPARAFYWNRQCFLSLLES